MVVLAPPVQMKVALVALDHRLVKYFANLAPFRPELLDTFKELDIFSFRKVQLTLFLVKPFSLLLIVLMRLINFCDLTGTINRYYIFFLRLF